MARRIPGVIAGLIVWFVVISAAGVVLRAAWPDYVSASPTMAFTLPMKLTRLSIGAVATIAAGIVTAILARSSAAVSITGVLLLLFFIPEHISLWDKFPIWYHLTFLGSLIPLTVGGGRLVRVRGRDASLAARN